VLFLPSLTTFDPVVSEARKEDVPRDSKYMGRKRRAFLSTMGYGGLCILFIVLIGHIVCMAFD
jgi:hypothetical protein